MTLISRLISSRFSVIAGEGATVSDGEKYDDKLRKVYINENSCIAFAGDHWITDALQKEGIYVSNSIEKFLEQNHQIENCQELSRKLVELLCANNDKIDTELFITMLENNEVINSYAKTLDKTIENITVSDDEFIVQFSRYPKGEFTLINNFFHKLWHDFFETENDGRLTKTLELHTQENVCRFMDYFYRRVSKLSFFQNVVIGRTADIVIFSSEKIDFFKKENLTIDEKY